MGIVDECFDTHRLRSRIMEMEVKRAFRELEDLLQNHGKQTDLHQLNIGAGAIHRYTKPENRVILFLLFILNDMK